MSYIGQGLPADTFQGFTTDKFTGDGTANKTFTLTKEPFSEDTILVTIDGVVQEPTDDFTVSGTTLTLVGTAPNNSEVNVTHMGGPLPIGGAAELDLNGASDKLILDADADTTISADTDDQIDVKIGGTDALRVTGTALTGNAVATIGATGTASTLAGIPFYSAATSSIYTHDVSGTDDGANYNTAYGIGALDAVTTGDTNVAIGYNAGTAIQDGEANTLLGTQAGQAVTSPAHNTLLGYVAGGALTTGATNIAIGSLSLDGCDTESNNLAIGFGALGGSVAGGEYNVAVGNYALTALTSSDGNVAVGYEAGKAITGGGDGVVLIGYQAGVALTDCSSSVFIGYQAGDGHDDEDHNIGIGRHAIGGSVAGGEYNVGMGSYTLDALTSGDENTSVGYNSSSGLSTGSSNTCLGSGAGNSLTTGSSNVLIGTNAGTGSSPFGALSDHDNHMVLGHNNITNAGIKVALTVTSDGRDKTDIEPFKMGLDFINELNPVTYRWDMRCNYSNKTPDGTHKKPELSAGLIAQDVEKLEREYGYKVEDKTSVITYVSRDGDYSLTYEKFIPVLINAVQELSAQVEELKTKLKEA